jgi:hypothetical protein
MKNKYVKRMVQTSPINVYYVNTVQQQSKQRCPPGINMAKDCHACCRKIRIQVFGGWAMVERPKK